MRKPILAMAGRRRVPCSKTPSFWREPPFSRRSIAFFENDNAFDITAAQRDLDFRPTIDLEDGLRMTADQVDVAA